ncbi:hypothetical protein HCN44_006236 [Aphidius gifuensis]|uniref:RING-type domain-containing protein n=1 Tax=Aphidius gifuensis TaxID=684658 RepID=A0A834XUU3_APHGI|nr:protein suppressor 2 of zeste-like [Aphidius gifuensis]KAF7993176.1 hypothetical protein HCN44_006236 [Aphidius gifuensis]
MSGQSGGRIKLSKLDEQLTCKLCRGYFIDATTIIECLHSFCRSCIVKYLNTNKYCPICEVQVHKSKPLLNIRPDHTLQDIVYKLVPGCYQSEMRCRREFYKKHPDAQRANMTPETRGEPIESHIYSPDESLSLSLEYYKPSFNGSPIPPCTESEEPSRRYLRCPAAVTVYHLQKLIRAKYGLSNVHRIDIMYKEEPLYGNYSLMDVMYIYHWRRKVPLHLSYRIFESSSKRLKLSDDNEEYKESLSNAGISTLNLDKVQHEDGIKKEWKEVQLKISETGVISVTGITNPDSKKNEQKETLEEDQRKLDESIEMANASKTENTMSKEKINKETSSTCTISEPPKISSDSQPGKHKLSMKADNIIGEKSNQTIDSGNNGKTPLESSAVIKKHELVSKSCEELQRPTSSLNTKNNNSTNQASGSKIDALSAKLQFHPKVGQVNNTYSKRGQKDKKTILEKVLKNTDIKKDIKEKINRTSGGGIIANLSNKLQINTSQTTPNPFYNLSYVPSVSISIASRKNASPDGVKDSPGSATGLGSARTDNSESSHQQQRLNNISANNKNLASIGLNVSTASCSSSSSNNTSTVQEFVNNAMRKSTPMSIYTIPSFTAVKNLVSGSSNNNNNNQNNSTNEKLCATPPSGTGKLNNFKPNSTGSNSLAPPCPDAIPISSMKPTIRKTEIIAKGTILNEICAKIGTSGSKINDICAKIGETSKEKDKNNLEIKTRPEIPDLLKISKKTMNDSSSFINIPNVPCYTPSSTSIFGSTDSKANKIIYTSSSQPTSSSISITSQSGSNIILKGGVSVVKKQSQYKTLRDPPKTWNPTLSKNQAKELHQSQSLVSEFESGSSGNRSSGSGNLKPIASKPAKIFKMRNVPKYLGNPASGVKPMYGVSNEGSGNNKESEQKLAKEQSPVSTVIESHEKNTVSNVSVTKTDTKTISPVVLTTKSPVVSPSLYSPSTGSYKNTPAHSKDTCHSTNSLLSPRNSPVNPFVPSSTPNTNPRLIYSHQPPTLSESTKFMNHSIHSPVRMASLSAFHSSLPPSINKLYQRTSYMSSSSSTHGQNTSSQSPTVQRTLSQSAPPKSPKTASSSSSSNSNPIKTETQATTDSTGNANKANQLIDNQESGTSSSTKVLASENLSTAVASDLSKTSSPSSKVVSTCTDNNPASSSDKEPNNTSNVSCNTIIDACKDSKKEHENKDEETSSKLQSNEKAENKEVKDSLNNIPKLKVNEQSTSNETNADS